MSRPLYGTQGFRAVAGSMLRPGGLELTARGISLMAEQGLAPGSAVLDLGCGPGATVAFLCELGFSATGVDIHPGEGAGAESSSVSAASGRLIAADLAALPFADGTFAGCTAECVLSLVPDLSKALSEAARVLEPGGLLFLSDLTLRERFGGRFSETPLEKHPFLKRGGSCLAGALPAEGWQQALETAGFSVLYSEDRSHDLAVLMAKLVWYDAADGLSWLLPQGQGGSQCACDVRKQYGYKFYLARRQENRA